MLSLFALTVITGKNDGNDQKRFFTVFTRSIY